ncbi:Phenol hydroxylase [Pseudomonas aeruginosa]|nr:Phenol hydroxylase [Pseudomonas aeruginosa]
MAAQEAHLRRAEEAGDEQVGRMVVKLQRRADLLDAPAVEHHDLVRQGHRLDLVVGHVDHGRRQFLVQPRQFQAHLHAQGGVEVGQRFVEEEYLRVAHDRPADRHPLPLAAGELARLALQQRLQFEDACGGVDLGGDLALVDAGQVEGEGEVPAHRHVRVQRVGLEDHRQVAFRRRGVGDVRAVEGDAAAAGLFEAGDQAQQGRLAAAGGADEDYELAVADVEVDALDDGLAVEAFLQVADLEISHGGIPPWTKGWGCASFHGAEGKAAYQLLLADPAEDQDRRAGEGGDGRELGPEQSFGAGIGGDQGGQRGGGRGGQVERPEGLVPTQDQRQQQGRGEPAAGDRQQYADDLLPGAGAVQARCFEDVHGDVLEVGVHHPDHDRQVDQGVDDDQRQPRIEQAELLGQQVDRHQYADRRKHLGRQHPEQRAPGVAGLEEGHGVGRRHRDEHAQESRRGGDQQRVPGVGEVVAALVDVQVVLQGRLEDELRRRGEGVDLALEAGQQHPEDREEQQQGDAPAEQAEQGIAQAAGLLECQHGGFLSCAR